MAQKRAEIWRSLKTSRRREAIQRIHPIAAEISGLFEQYAPALSVGSAAKSPPARPAMERDRLGGLGPQNAEDELHRLLAENGIQIRRDCPLRQSLTAHVLDWLSREVKNVIHEGGRAPPPSNTAATSMTLGELIDRYTRDKGV